MSLRWTLGITVTLALAGLVALSGCSTPTPTPDGYTSVRDGLAIRWGTATKGDCSFYDGCVKLEVLAMRDCDGVYVEANVEDDREVVVDRANGTLGELKNGQAGEIILGQVGHSGSKFSLTRVTCH
jgi:hypothetical protein